MYVHQLHDYSDFAYYFLTESNDPGLKISESDYSHLSPQVQIESYDAFAFHELEERNLLKSGRTWYGEWFSYSSSQTETFTFPFDGLIANEELKLKTAVIARSTTASTFKTFINGEQDALQTITIPSVQFSSSTGNFAREGIMRSSFYSNKDEVAVSIQYVYPNNTAFGWLDYLCLNARCQLNLKGDQLQFRDRQSMGSDIIAQFKIQNTNANTVIWNVSDPTRPKKVKSQTAGTLLSFNHPQYVAEEFVAFNPGAAFPVPEFVEEVPNQNLHGISNTDYIIVAPEEFLSEAYRLAGIHESHSGLTTVVVTPSEIYNEFSSGQADVSAIRDFLRHLYLKAESDEAAPKYLLLFGDGSFDNRSQDEDNTNRIITYQSVNSLHQSMSYVSDDFFGCLDNHEGSNLQTDKLDIGIGRFPVNTLQEARSAVDKTENYLYNQNKGNWKGLLTFIGDDGDYNIHMRDADRLSQKVSQKYPEFDHHKIYFDSYQKITTSSGKSYPEVNSLVEKSIADGTMIFNYTGHGGEKGLAHERMITIPDIQGWTNYDRLPLFVTATCEFSRYDDRYFTSAGEWVFLNKLGGGIALFTTTRLVYSSLNFEINNNLYDYIFEKDDKGNKLRMGDIIRFTKNASGTSVNILNFTLLGDPALQLIYPSKLIETTKVNQVEMTHENAILRALSKASIDGQIIRQDSSLIGDFNGQLDITVYDKPSTVVTLGNDGAQPFVYEVYQNKLFKGSVSVSNGLFTSDFIVPKDIRYHIDKGRVSYYSFDEAGNSAFGASNDLMIGGITDTPPTDTKGPQITLYLNTPSFRSGDATGVRPLLIAHLHDENGINTSGNGIGHDISLIVDDNRSQTSILNAYFQSELDNYQEGMVSYQLPQQIPGLHKLAFKAWDNLNNSTTVEILFEVKEGGELKVDQVKFGPNPVRMNDKVQLIFSHDEPNSSMTITTRTFDLSGQLTKQNTQQTISVGGQTHPIEWHAVSATGQPLQPRIYILQFQVNVQTGKSTHFSEKILVTP
jgi:hypothetical protein